MTKYFLAILVLLVILYWYFNIRGKTRCITILQECTDIDCIKSNI